MKASRCLKKKKRINNFGEVFTPQGLVSEMVDLVQDEIESIDSKFLEPAAGTGNFLIEILKRKLSVAGALSESDFPENSLRVLRSIHGIELLPDNVEVARKRMFQAFIEAYFLYIGNYDRSIHKEVKSVIEANIIQGDYLKEETSSYDVVITNPPYQKPPPPLTKQKLSPAIYHLFCDKATGSGARKVVMIIPRRGYASGTGVGFKRWRHKMIADTSIKKIVNFPSRKECFQEADVRAGVLYFLGDRDYSGKCNFVIKRKGEVVSDATRFLKTEGAETVIYFNSGVSIFKKVINHPDFKPMSDAIGYSVFFGLQSNHKEYERKPFPGAIKVFMKRKEIGGVKPSQITRNKAELTKHKVLMKRLSGKFENLPMSLASEPFYTPPLTANTATYLNFLALESRAECENLISYIETKFYQFMLFLRKISNGSAKNEHTYVPKQSFDKRGTDEELFKKYNLTKEEIDFINKTIA